MEQKKLYRSRSNRMICGVCGGVGEYFNPDTSAFGTLRLHRQRYCGILYSCNHNP